MDVYDQVIQLFTAKHRFIKNVDIEKIQDYEAQLVSHIHALHNDLLEDIKAKRMISEETEAKLKDVIGKFTNDYISE